MPILTASNGHRISITLRNLSGTLRRKDKYPRPGYYQDRTVRLFIDAAEDPFNPLLLSDPPICVLCV